MHMFYLCAINTSKHYPFCCDNQWIYFEDDKVVNVETIPLANNQVYLLCTDSGIKGITYTVLYVKQRYHVPDGIMFHSLLIT